MLAVLMCKSLMSRIVGRPPTPYDLLWPVGLRKRLGQQTVAKVTETPAASTVLGPPAVAGKRNGANLGLASIDGPSDASATSGAYLDLQAYAHSLLGALPEVVGADASAAIGLRATPRPPIPSLALTDHRLSEAQGVDFAEEGTPLGCREAVEILTRNPKKRELYP